MNQDTLDVVNKVRNICYILFQVKDASHSLLWIFQLILKVFIN